MLKGMPYKYIVATRSIAFQEAPPVIMTALSRLTWAGKESVKGGIFQDFNELLVLGYMESGKISVCFQ
jgi:hypothetical protein